MSDETPTPEILKTQFLQVLRMRNRSSRTLTSWRYRIDRFIRWCEDRGVACVTQVTSDILMSYRRHLFHHQNCKTNAPIKFSTQCGYLIPIRRWFLWLYEEKHILENVVLDFELPKEERRLPSDVLNQEEVELLINQPDVTQPLGLRDRAILETFYSTGIRCSELCDLQVYDLEVDRGVVKINQGKGGKDRVVPIGKRALSWIEKYSADVRPTLATRTNTSTLFISCFGRPLGRNNVSAIVKSYLRLAGIKKRGSCHLIRHTAATLMMENGADLRTLQMFLGHERLNTTQIYTHVSITHLKEVHEKTHPAKLPGQKAK